MYPNAHIVQGSKGTNSEEKKLLEYLISPDLNILNMGNNPNFFNSGMKEISEFTLGTTQLGILAEY
jgi:hypothetical protein